jgi:hypothetical protein
VLEVYVAAGFNVAGVLVVIEFVRPQLHICGFDAHGAAHVAQGAVDLLSNRLNID